MSPSPLNANLSLGVVEALKLNGPLAGQVLLLWGENDYGEHSSTGLHVDLASNVCMPQGLPSSTSEMVAQQYASLTVASYAQETRTHTLLRMCGKPASGASHVARIWTPIPALSAGRADSYGCVMTDGRFAVLGGHTTGLYTTSCEALMVDKDEHCTRFLPCTTHGAALHVQQWLDVS
jgi:hypothetical protein